MKNTILSAIEIAKDGGVTYNMENGILSNLPFYCISKAQHELEVDELTEDVVRDYILKHAELLAQDGVCLGMWKDKGKYYLDITDLWDKDEYTEAGALEIGRLRSQKAIFDLETMTEKRCHDFEMYTKDDSFIVEPTNDRAMEFMRSRGYEDVDGKFHFMWFDGVSFKDPKDLDRVAILNAGFTCLAY
jgi:hypothetical protein